MDNRFIPAGAGNALAGDRRRSHDAVHPRRRGERMSQDYNQWQAAGSSPQARGTRGGPGALRQNHRFIPAGAGNAA